MPVNSDLFLVWLGMSWTYVLPLVIYLLGTSVIGSTGLSYPVAYTGVVIVAGVVSAYLVGRNRPFPVHGRVGWGILFGLVGIGLWIWLCSLNLERHLDSILPKWLGRGERESFDPFGELSSLRAAWAFIGVRLLGLVVLVPIAEELFWRGFLARWLASDKWEDVPLGKFSPWSFAIVTLVFALAHPEWLAAAVYCMLLNGLLAWKKDLWQCVVAHATSNLVLAVYILTAGAWELW